jgi:hypothetical protein
VREKRTVLVEKSRERGTAETHKRTHRRCRRSESDLRAIVWYRVPGLRGEGPGSDRRAWSRVRVGRGCGGGGRRALPGPTLERQVGAALGLLLLLHDRLLISSHPGVGAVLEALAAAHHVAHRVVRQGAASVVTAVGITSGWAHVGRGTGKGRRGAAPTGLVASSTPAAAASAAPAAAAWFAVLHQHWHGDPPGRARTLEQEKFIAC